MTKIKNFFESNTYNRFSIVIIIIAIILGIFRTIGEPKIEDKILYGIFALVLILILPTYFK